MAEFGRDHSARFKEQVGACNRDDYNSIIITGIITGRNRSAHGQPIRVTLGGAGMWRNGAKEARRGLERALAPPPAPDGARGNAL